MMFAVHAGTAAEEEWGSDQCIPSFEEQRNW